MNEYPLPRTGITVEQYLIEGLQKLKESAALNGEDCAFLAADILLRQYPQALPTCPHQFPECAG